MRGILPLAVAALAVTAVSASAAEYNLVNLRSLTSVPGFVATTAEGVSSNGDYVTGRGTQTYTTAAGSSASYTTAYRYQLSTNTLQVLPEVSPGSYLGPNYGLGVTDSGFTTGSGSFADGSTFGQSRGFFTSGPTAGGITVPSGTPGFTLTGTVGRAVNNAGLIAGDQVNNNGGRAFVFRDANNNLATDAGEIAALPLPTGLTMSLATSVNDRGQVLGSAGATTASSVRQVVVWTPGTDGTYAARQIAQGTAGGINDDGDFAFYDSNNLGYFYRDPDGDGPLAASAVTIDKILGRTSIFTNDVNDSDLVVGAIAGTGVQRLAFVWDEVNKMRDLNTLIPATGGVILSHANAISDNGVISVNGTFNGANAGYVLVPVSVPEPAALAAVGLAAAALLRRR
jgi:hypothetical protein